jgi:hypothetical protein
MAARPSLWVYKCNAARHAHQIATGDWDGFFAGPQPGEWGGSTTMASTNSLKILWQRMQPGDLVLCWQTDRKRAVGLCQVNALDDWIDAEGQPQRDMWLELLGEPFSPPVPLLDLKKSDPRVGAVRAFQSGFMGTLYETNATEGTDLLRACGISPKTLASLQSSPSRGASPHGGAGFGSPAENRKVEQAAVRVLRAAYKSQGWKLTDFQKDNLGYDFSAVRHQQERHIELKGARGPMPSFPITEHEVAVARTDPLWRLAVVTNALSKVPSLTEWSGDAFLLEFYLRPLSHFARRR